MAKVKVVDSPSEYWAVKQCESLFSPAIFTNWDDCRAFLKDALEEDQLQSINNNDQRREKKTKKKTSATKTGAAAADDEGDAFPILYKKFDNALDALQYLFPKCTKIANISHMVNTNDDTGNKKRKQQATSTATGTTTPPSYYGKPAVSYYATNGGRTSSPAPAKKDDSSKQPPKPKRVKTAAQDKVVSGTIIDDAVFNDLTKISIAVKDMEQDIAMNRKTPRVFVMTTSGTKNDDNDNDDSGKTGTTTTSVDLATLNRRWSHKFLIYLQFMSEFDEGEIPSLAKFTYSPEKLVMYQGMPEWIRREHGRVREYSGPPVKIVNLGETVAQARKRWAREEEDATKVKLLHYVNFSRDGGAPTTKPKTRTTRRTTTTTTAAAVAAAAAPQQEQENNGNEMAGLNVEDGNDINQGFC